MLFHIDRIITNCSAWFNLHRPTALSWSAFINLHFDVQAVVTSLHHASKNGTFKRSGFHRGHCSCHSLSDISQLCHFRNKYAFIGFLAVTETTLGLLQIQRVDV